jgi:hypothetical protein
VSKYKADYLRGHFNLERLKEIADSAKTDTWELQCIFERIDKPWRMFKFKVQE